jgi:diaphanous 1
MHCDPKVSESETLLNASQALLAATLFPRVLALVLDIGNYLNAGTRAGNAMGFRLASLLALKDTRSADGGKTSLLDYLVEVRLMVVVVGT